MRISECRNFYQLLSDGPSPRISASSRGRFLLAYFVFLLSRDALSRTARRRFGRGLIASCAKWSAAVSSRSAESFIQRTSLRPCSHGIRIDTLPASACSSGQGALLRKSAQGHPGSRLPLISPSGGCRRRTAPLPARSSAARAVSRPARSSCPGP